MILLLVVVGALATLAAAEPRVVVVETGGGRPLLCHDARSGSLVTVSFTHSMFGGYVREQWRVTDDNQFRRTRFVTENAAAAEYYATDGRITSSADGFVVEGDPPIEGDIVVRVDRRGDHWLEIDGARWHLAGMVGQSTQVRISVTDRSEASCPEGATALAIPESARA